MFSGIRSAGRAAERHWRGAVRSGAADRGDRGRGLPRSSPMAERAEAFLQTAEAPDARLLNEGQFVTGYVAITHAH